MEPATRRQSTRQPLSLTSIVDAAVAIADREGLDSVSIRRVASELQGRPMSLYSFIDSKEGLVARMLDAVVAEMVVDELPGNWREALLAIAQRTMEVGERHPWMVVASVQSGVPGPNMVAHGMQTFEALAGLGVDEARARSFAQAIDVYTIGFATVSGAGPDAPADRRQFMDGITWLLDGFERELASAATAAGTAAGSAVEVPDARQPASLPEKPARKIK